MWRCRLQAERPSNAQQTAPRRLTLQDAIGLALKQNLSVRVASTQVEELEGTRDRRRASLLPHVNGDALANRENIDLARHGNFLSHRFLTVVGTVQRTMISASRRANP